MEELFQQLSSRFGWNDIDEHDLELDLEAYRVKNNDINTIIDNVFNEMQIEAKNKTIIDDSDDDNINTIINKGFNETQLVPESKNKTIIDDSDDETTRNDSTENIHRNLKLNINTPLRAISTPQIDKKSQICKLIEKRKNKGKANINSDLNKFLTQEKSYYYSENESENEYINDSFVVSGSESEINSYSSDSYEDELSENENIDNNIISRKYNNKIESMLSFKRKKKQYAKDFFIEFNKTIFNNKLPDNVPISFNKRLQKTAGRCIYRKIENKCTVELSTHVIDNRTRLMETLIHELCHAATHIIDKVPDTEPPHGKVFKKYITLASRKYPELTLSRCHNYEIAYKYQYKCVKCDYIYGRQSKSINVEKSRCGRPGCLGVLELVY